MDPPFRNVGYDFIVGGRGGSVFIKEEVFLYDQDIDVSSR